MYGRVHSVQRGRVVANADGSARLVTRFVELDVCRLLAGAFRGDTLAVEEEGWLPDGRVLLVNGELPSSPDDVGVWFLNVSRQPDGAVFSTLGVFGRILVEGDSLRVPAVKHPVADEIRRTTPAVLLSRIAVAARESIPPSESAEECD